MKDKRKWSFDGYRIESHETAQPIFQTKKVLPKKIFLIGNTFSVQGISNSMLIIESETKQAEINEIYATKGLVK